MIEESDLGSSLLLRSEIDSLITIGIIQRQIFFFKEKYWNVKNRQAIHSTVVARERVFVLREKSRAAGGSEVKKRMVEVQALFHEWINPPSAGIKGNRVSPRMRRRSENARHKGKKRL